MQSNRYKRLVAVRSYFGAVQYVPWESICRYWIKHKITKEEIQGFLRKENITQLKVWMNIFCFDHEKLGLRVFHPMYLDWYSIKEAAVYCRENGIKHAKIMFIGDSRVRTISYDNGLLGYYFKN